MRYEIVKEVRYFDEALFIAEILVNDKLPQYEALQQQPAIRQNSQKAHLLAEIINIIQEVQQKCGRSLTADAGLFSYLKDLELSVADCILTKQIVSPEATDALLKRARQLSLEERVRHYYDRIEDGDDQPASPAIGIPQLLTLMSELQISESIQWQLLKSLYQPQETIDRLLEIIRPIEEILIKHAKLLQEAADFALAYLDQVMQKNDLADLLKQELALDLHADLALYIRPAIFYPFQLTAAKFGSKRLIMAFGCIFDFEMLKINDQFQLKKVSEIGKIIQDESKLKILQALKQQPMYGRQLADQLQLTTATISHHMNALYAGGLVYIEIQANRTYYRLNRDQITESLKRIETLLLK
ncbi:hypothetical protein SDC9_122274 [bioreactor metagenome]|uniref:HTH arsR-type domain-containing protein n=1 Tax=bioreactor metagenome TaxID=1076179 RepID=A0A645CEK1_9ZZZZ